MLICNLPPALLAECPESFTCHCGNTGVERTPTKSQRTKFTLEKKILPPLLPGFELATFWSRVRRSYQQAILRTEFQNAIWISYRFWKSTFVSNDWDWMYNTPWRVAADLMPVLASWRCFLKQLSCRTWAEQRLLWVAGEPGHLAVCGGLPVPWSSLTKLAFNIDMKSAGHLKTNSFISCCCFDLFYLLNKTCFQGA